MVGGPSMLRLMDQTLRVKRLSILRSTGMSPSSSISQVGLSVLRHTSLVKMGGLSMYNCVGLDSLFEQGDEEEGEGEDPLFGVWD